MYLDAMRPGSGSCSLFPGIPLRHNSGMDLSVAAQLQLCKGDSCEENVSAVQCAAQADPWFPRPHGHARRACRNRSTSAQGPPPPDRVTRGRKPVVPGSHAFPPSARITRAAEYKFVFERGERVAGRHFVCHVARQEGGGCRLGFAVSRKVGNAVARNRVKRRLREFFRTHRDGFAPDVLLVVVAKPGAADLDWSGLSGELERLLRRGGVIRGKADDSVH